jgi:hypothetical protein
LQIQVYRYTRTRTSTSTKYRYSYNKYNNYRYKYNYYKYKYKYSLHLQYYNTIQYNTTMSFAKVESQSPVLTHFKASYPLYARAEKFALSYAFVAKLVEFASSYLLVIRGYLNKYTPSLLHYEHAAESFVVDGILVKYVDAYAPFILKDHHLSEIKENKAVDYVKTLPGVQSAEKIATSAVVRINSSFVIRLGKLVDSGVGESYKASSPSSGSLVGELHSTLTLLDEVAGALKSRVVSLYGKTVPVINGAAASVKENAAKAADGVSEAVSSGVERVEHSVNGDAII